MADDEKYALAYASRDQQIFLNFVVERKRKK